METNFYTPDFFSEFGYTYFENILSKEDCEHFAEIILKNKNENKMSYEGGSDFSPSSFYGNSYGLGGISIMEEMMRNIQPKVENQIGVKIKHANSFSRIYYNGGTLNSHIDRQGLDYTMSITLRSNLDKEWPLYFKDLKNNVIKLNINEGDGGLILGTKLEHWREPLICKDNEYFIVMFMHWSFFNES
jgi:hypothetical protein